MCLYFLGYLCRRGAGGGQFRLAHPVIGKIDRRFGPGQGRDQAAPASLHKDRPGRLHTGAGPGATGPGFRPRLRSATASARVRSKRPFSTARRLNSPGSAGRRPNRQKRPEQGLAHRPPAMDMEFGHILAGETVRGRETRAAGPGPSASPCQESRRRLAWRGGGFRRPRLPAPARPRARNPHHRQPGPARRAGQGEDRGIPASIRSCPSCRAMPPGAVPEKFLELLKRLGAAPALPLKNGIQACIMASGSPVSKAAFIRACISSIIFCCSGATSGRPMKARASSGVMSISICTFMPFTLSRLALGARPACGLACGPAGLRSAAQKQAINTGRIAPRPIGTE